MANHKAARPAAPRVVRGLQASPLARSLPCSPSLAQEAYLTACRASMNCDRPQLPHEQSPAPPAPRAPGSALPSAPVAVSTAHAPGPKECGTVDVMPIQTWGPDPTSPALCQLHRGHCAPGAPLHACCGVTFFLVPEAPTFPPAQSLRLWCKLNTSSDPVWKALSVTQGCTCTPQAGSDCHLSCGWGAMRYRAGDEVSSLLGVKSHSENQVS